MVLFLFFGISISSAQEKKLVVTDAWVRAVPPVLKNTAGFVTIDNQTNETMELTGLYSDVTEVVELHRMVSADGRMKMEMIKNFKLMPGEKINFEDEYLHLMFINLIKPVNDGDVVNVHLVFNHDIDVDVRAVVSSHEMSGHEKSVLKEKTNEEK